MKKITFLFVALMMCSLAFAQKNHGKGKGEGQKKTPEQKAEAVTQRLTKNLGLTPEQQPRVKEIVLQKSQKIRDIRSKYSNGQDKKKMHEEVKTVRTEAESSLKGVLTQEQWDKYLKAKEERQTRAKTDPNHNPNEPSEEDDDMY